MRSSVSTHSLTMVAAATLLMSVGCGPDTDRLEINGEVTLDGVPLDHGSIRFSSLGTSRVFATGALIKNGAYHIPREKGLPPGTYHLEISAPDNDAPPVVVRDASGQPGIPTAPERIPAEYNVESQKSIEVTPDGENHFVFDIVSQSARVDELGTRMRQE